MFDVDSQSPWVRRKIRSSNIPVRYLGWTFDDLSPYKGTMLDEVKEYCLTFSEGNILKAEGSSNCGKGLLLAGGPGMGKTALACVTAQHVLRSCSSQQWFRNLDKPVFFTTYPEYLSSLQRSFDKEEDSLEQIVMKAGLLVLDDLGKEHKTASGWAEATFDVLLRLRFDKGLPTVVTTNLPKSKWGSVYGEAMGSFANEAFTSFVVIAPEGDRRSKG